jgi:hypothetical protein
MSPFLTKGSGFESDVAGDGSTGGRKMTPENPGRQKRHGTEARNVDYPTVLVARDDDGLDGPVVHFLRRHGFHVLEADRADVFDVVRVHSRPIHLLLADVSMDAHVPILKKHRSELQVLFVRKPVDADIVLAKGRLKNKYSVRVVRRSF